MHLKMFPILLYCTCISLSKADSLKITDQVYFDIAVGERYLGRVIIGLFGEIAPMTVKNFLEIATTGIEGKTYTGSKFHRVIKRFMIQGGDIVNGDGTGSISVYGINFPDENFMIQHQGAGFVSMANSGPDANGCQFFITTTRTPWLDGHHTVFGKVVDGQEIIHQIEQVKTDSDYRPLTPVTILQSGSIQTSAYIITDEFYTLFQIIKAGAVPLGMSFMILAFFGYVIRKLSHYERIKEHAM